MKITFVAPQANSEFTIDPGTAASGPSMPSITAQVKIEKAVPPSFTLCDVTAKTKAKFKWKATICYPGKIQDTVPGRPSAEVNTDNEFTEETAQPTWTFRFPRFRGGELTIRCEVIAAGEGPPVTAELTGPQIKGKNPPRSVVWAAIGSNQVLKQICLKESGGRQFSAAADTGVSVHPVWNEHGDGGVGLFQITNPAPTADQIWNWLANVKRGIEIYDDKKKQTKAYQNGVSGSDDFKGKVRMLNEARQQDNKPPLAQVTVPKFTDEQFENDTIRAFNGYGFTDSAGNFVHEYRVAMDATSGQLVLDGTGQAQWEQVTAAEREKQWKAKNPGKAYPGEVDYVNKVRQQTP